jgi:hypothetical protein
MVKFLVKEKKCPYKSNYFIKVYNYIMQIRGTGMIQTAAGNKGAF